MWAATPLKGSTPTPPPRRFKRPSADGSSGEASSSAAALENAMRSLNVAPEPWAWSASEDVVITSELGPLSNLDLIELVDGGGTLGGRTVRTFVPSSMAWVAGDRREAPTHVVLSPLGVSDKSFGILLGAIVSARFVVSAVHCWSRKPTPSSPRQPHVSSRSLHAQQTAGWLSETIETGQLANETKYEVSPPRTHSLVDFEVFVVQPHLQHTPKRELKHVLHAAGVPQEYTQELCGSKEEFGHQHRDALLVRRAGAACVTFFDTDASLASFYKANGIAEEHQPKAVGGRPVLLSVLAGGRRYVEALSVDDLYLGLCARADDDWPEAMESAMGRLRWAQHPPVLCSGTHSSTPRASARSCAGTTSTPPDP